MERGRQRDRRETEKEKWSVEGSIFCSGGGCWAAHWYDSLIFWALLWSSLRGHPSIIRPVTSSLSSSSAFTLHMCLCDSKLCMCGSKYMCFSPCAHVCVSVRVRRSPEFPISDHMQGNVELEQLLSWQHSSPTNWDKNLPSINTPTFNTAEDRVHAVCVYICVCVSA